MQERLGSNLHIDALTLVTTLHLLTLCRLAVRLAHRRCPPPLPAGPGGAPRTYSEASLLLIARLANVVAAFPTWDMRDWLRDWPALALARALPLDPSGTPRIKSASQQWKRGHRAGAPGPEALFCLTVQAAIRRRLIGARDLIIVVRPFWPGDVPTRTLLSAMPRLSTPAHSYAAIACIPCSVAARACPFSFYSHQPTSMMRRLLVRSWSGLYTSTTFARA